MVGADKDILVTDSALESNMEADFRTHLRLPDDNVDSAHLILLLTAARQAIELHTKRAIFTQTRELALDNIPGSPPGSSDSLGWWDGVREGALVQEQVRAISLPVGPLLTVASIKYYADDDTETTWSSTNYHVDVYTRPGRVVLKQGGTWPAFTRMVNGIIIQYTCGYGATVASAPADLRQAIFILAADYYEHRNANEMGSIPARVKRVLDPILEKYRVIHL